MEEKKIQNKNVLFLFLIIIILIGGFLVYNNFNNKEEQKVVVEKSPIEITNNDDGTKTVRNVEEGYEVEVDSELNVDFIDGKLSIQSQDNINQILPDLSFILQKTNKTSALIFFKEEFNKLNDQGLQVEELSSFELNNVIVDYIKVDYKNSEWTSNGEVVYIYHFVIKEQNFIIVDTSFNENILKNNINKIKSFISSIKN
ncbi:MAG TPA: hypothetical protein PK831_03650 [Candidatus Magasanikbacteria bacterium]|jgi:hypothetical protein|nr:hypothetical protein [Candidatus Magasanikbacteria bacterium]